MLRLRILLPALALGAALLSIPLTATPAYAHGFGERYDLPLPLSYFTAGGAAAVILSFAVIGFFVRAEAASGYPRFNLFRYAPVRVLLGGPVWWLLRLVSLFLFFLVIATGLFGSERPADNLTPAFVWIIWWVGMGFVVSLLGNLWAIVNPWRILYDLAEAIYHRFRPEEEEWEPGPGWDYPAQLGVWPSVFLFLAFAWVENALPDNAAPAVLAGLIIAYSVVTLGGMYLFGKQQWLRQGEVFSVIYGLLARFSVTEVRVVDRAVCRECGAPMCGERGCGERGCGERGYGERGYGERGAGERGAGERGAGGTGSGGPGAGERADATGCIDCYECFEYAGEREFNLRPPAIGLDAGGAVAPGTTALVLLVLATVTFDGFSDTPEWSATLGFFLSLTPGLTFQYFNGLVIANTLGLLAFPLAFAGLYWSFAVLMRRAVAGRGPAAGQLMEAFVFSLVPIALAYHFAHYLGFLLIQGQLIIPLASDPFGAGWDLFGSASYAVNIAITNARFIWFFSLASIVAGHIIAVYLAHRRAGTIYQTRNLALRSQLPMLALMALYTVVSLWIISRPITE